MIIASDGVWEFLSNMQVLLKKNLFNIYLLNLIIIILIIKKVINFVLPFYKKN